MTPFHLPMPKDIWMITLRAAVFFTQFLLPKTEIIALTCLSFPKRIIMAKSSAKPDLFSAFELEKIEEISHEWGFDETQSEYEIIS